MLDLQAFHASHAKAGFFIIAIESGEPANQVVSFVQNYGLTSRYGWTGKSWRWWPLIILIYPVPM